MKEKIKSIFNEYYLEIIFLVVAIIFILLNRNKAILGFKYALSTYKNLLIVIIGVAFLSGIISEIIDDNIVKKFIGKESRFKGVLIGAIFGTLMVGPAYIYYPFFKELLNKGAKINILATTTIAPDIFSNLNSKLTLYNEKPDGKKINVGCGSTNPHFLSNEIKKNGFDLGFSFDGDGDRVIAFDENGEIIDGDVIMFILAKYLKLPSIVITVMSNYGLKVLLKKYDINYYKVPVGDRNVLYKMVEVNSPLGGEQSGHIIYLPQSKTGDGIITSLLLLKVILKENKPFSEIKKEFIRYPQVLRNVKVKNKKLIMNDEVFFKEVNLWNEKLNGKGRILIRPSGTENLIRIMVEGEKEKEVENIALSLEDLLIKRLAQKKNSG